ncbi:MAG: SPOR domain-containing protein [Betaproteobacteria bacterium]
MAASSNPAISSTELELKRRGRRRLIGAITIGLLAIVFLPMVFDREPKRAGLPMKVQDISVQVPSKEGQPPLAAPSAAPIVVPATAPAVPEPSTPAVADAPKAVAAPGKGKVAAPPVLPPPVVKEPAKAVAKADKPAKADSPSPADKSGFAVQLGVFSDADNAKQVIAKMKEARLSVYTENIPIKSGNATRVRVGPFASRDKADAALAQVKLAGTDGKIVPLK